MPDLVGRNLPLSLPRRFICDLVHFAKQVPSVPMERRMDLSALVEARRGVEPRPTWCAIFLKAYSLVAARRPELRRAYLPFPWPHLYEHPCNVASVGIERQYRGEDAVFFGRIVAPELQSLRAIDLHLRRYKEQPIERIGTFNRVLRLSRWPRFLRRLAWWYGLNASGARRARYFGTFGISVVAALGAAGLHLLSPLTTALNYGVFSPDGSLDVRITYDHRVLDGAPVARAMTHLEEVLCGEVLQEIRSLQTFNVGELHQTNAHTVKSLVVLGS